MATTLAQIQLASHNAADWDVDKILKLGQKGIETDTLLEKTGDGVTTWGDLGYLNVRIQDVKTSSGYLSADGVLKAEDITFNNTADIVSTNVQNAIEEVYLKLSSGGQTLPPADATHDGYLIQGDWATFNSKVSAAGYGSQDEIIVAVSDETTDITTGTAKMTFYCPRAYKLIMLKASLNAITSGTCTFTINKGTTTLATINCTAVGITSSGALTADLALNDAITVDISGTFTGANGGKIYFVWYATGAA